MRDLLLAVITLSIAWSLTSAAEPTPDDMARAALALASPAKTYRSVMADPPRASTETTTGRVIGVGVAREELWITLEIGRGRTARDQTFTAMKGAILSVNGTVYADAPALLADWYASSTNAETAEIDSIPERYGHVRAVRFFRPPLTTLPRAKVPAKGPVGACVCGGSCPGMWGVRCHYCGCGRGVDAAPLGAKAPACSCRSCPDDGFRYVLDRDGSIAGRQCTCGCGRFHPGAGLPQIRRQP